MWYKLRSVDVSLDMKFDSLKSKENFQNFQIKSFSTPKSEKNISPFRTVLVTVNETDRYTEYTLIHHPYFDKKRLKKKKPRTSKKKVHLKNSTLDYWV